MDRLTDKERIALDKAIEGDDALVASAVEWERTFGPPCKGGCGRTVVQCRVISHDKHGNWFCQECKGGLIHGI